MICFWYGMEKKGGKADFKSGKKEKNKDSRMSRLQLLLPDCAFSSLPEEVLLTQRTIDINILYLLDLRTVEAQ